MKKSTAIVLLALCLLLLTGCSCKHEWQEASCTVPKTCSLCQETEGEPLGHSWQEATCETAKVCSTCALVEGTPLGHDWAEATCETAKTCSRCLLTEGDPLGHTYSPWEMGEETMTRSCSNCNEEESAAADWNVYISNLLEGRWICHMISLGDMEMETRHYFNQPPFLDIHNDQTLRFFNGENNFTAALEFYEEVDLEDKHGKAFWAVDNGERKFLFVHEVPLGESEMQESILGYGGYGHYYFERESEEDRRVRQELVGTWNSTEREYDSGSGYVRKTETGHSITFRDDYGFTATIDGEQIEGFWSKSFLQEDERLTRYVYHLKYSQDNSWVYLGAFICHFHDGSSPSTYSINFSNEYTIYYTPEQVF